MSMYMVSGRSINKNTGVLQSVCQRVVVMQDGQSFLGKERVYLDSVHDLGVMLELSYEVEVKK